MPESPEADIMAEDARSVLLGRDILDLWECGGRFVKLPVPGLDLELRRSLPKRVLDVERRGKAVLVRLEDEVTIVVTFGMSGRFSLEREKHAGFRVSHGTIFDVEQLYFVDPRHFGTVRIFRGDLEGNLPSLGWDALSQEVDVSRVRSTLERHARDRTVGEVLLDGRIFSGIGNYLRAEGLWAAKISPRRRAKELSNEELENLCRELRRLTLRSRELGGCTLRSFSSLRGNGTFSSELTAYGRITDPLGNAISREKDSSGRTVWWAPARQT